MDEADNPGRIAEYQPLSDHGYFAASRRFKIGRIVGTVIWTPVFGGQQMLHRHHQRDSFRAGIDFAIFLVNGPLQDISSKAGFISMVDCWNDSLAGAPVDCGAWRDGDCARRVLRGGSWINHPWQVRSASRIAYRPTERSPNLGFRVARDLDGSGLGP